MINAYQNGGFKLQDLETKIKSLHIKWLKPIADPDYQAAWKEYLGTIFRKNQDLEAIVEYNTKKKYYHNFADSFHDGVFGTWASLHCKQPTTNEQVVREIL
jgi:hypothetical protein